MSKDRSLRSLKDKRLITFSANTYWAFFFERSGLLSFSAAVYYQFRDKITQFSLYIYAREICFIACFRSIKNQHAEYLHVACFDSHFEMLRNTKQKPFVFM